MWASEWTNWQQWHGGDWSERYDAGWRNSEWKWCRGVWLMKSESNLPCPHAAYSWEPCFRQIGARD